MSTKTHRLFSIAAFFIAAALCFTILPITRLDLMAEVDTSTENEAALRAKLSALQKEQDEIKQKLQEAKNDLGNTEKRKENLDALSASTSAEIDYSEQLIEEYDQKVRTKQAEISDMEDYIDRRFETTMQRLRFSYEDGAATYLDLILSSDSLTDFLSSTERVESMMEFDRSLMDERSAKLKALSDERTVLQNTLDEQVALKATLEEKKAELDSQLKDAQDLISQLRSDEQKYAAEYEKIKAAENAANDEINRIIAERQKTLNTPAATGDYIWPVPGRTYISSPFGHRDLYGKDDYHRGIDIPAPQGTPIVACNSGTVIKATWHYSWGNYIVIDHGGGYATLYAHCSRLLVSEGDNVSRGDLIGKVGETGNAFGAHLHLEFSINGKLVNPLNYVKR